MAGVNVDIKTAVRLKRMGLTAGFPDLQLMVPGSLKTDGEVSAGLLIELKTERGSLSDVQALYHKKLRSMNYTVIIVRSLEEAIAWIKTYLERVPNLREKVWRPCQVD